MGPFTLISPDGEFRHPLRNWSTFSDHRLEYPTVRIPVYRKSTAQLVARMTTRAVTASADRSPVRAYQWPGLCPSRTPRRFRSA